MLTLDRRVAGDSVQIHVMSDSCDVDRFQRWVLRNRRALAVDTETTGIDIYSPAFRLRVVQFGNHRESWVIPVEAFPRMIPLVVETLEVVQSLFMQNGSFDIKVLAQHAGIDIRDTWKKTYDTRLVAHLIDSRSKEHGGVGHSLEQLVGAYIDSQEGLKIKESAGAAAKALKVSKAKYFSTVDLFDHTYLAYAGMDTILTSRLWSALSRLIPPESVHLINFDRQVSMIGTLMDHKGFLLDTEYAEALAQRLGDKAEDARQEARQLGLENVNSTQQVADFLLTNKIMSVLPTTDKGNYTVDKNVIDPLIEKGEPIAIAIHDAKKYDKIRTTWVQKFLDEADSNHYCHPSTNTLQARTGRMSIQTIPAQTLPSDNWLVRRCFMAEDGFWTASTDYMAQELRVAAALSGDPVMLKAFREGADLHQLTADAAGVPRKAGKGTNFTVMYGGAVQAIIDQWKVDRTTAERAYKAFWDLYKGVKTFNDKLSAQAREHGYVVTGPGRRLYVDKQRPYAALNYMIQSTSADMVKQALVRLDQQGYTPYLRLPVHDEIVSVVPKNNAEKHARSIGDIMASELRGLPVGTDSEVVDRTWGSLYFRDNEGGLVGRDPELVDWSG